MLTKECLVDADQRTASAALGKSSSGECRGVCFVDEAQILMMLFLGRFCSAAGDKARYCFYALAKGLGTMGDSGDSGYPVFCGTGLSIDALKEETNAVMVKPARKTFSPVFSGLSVLGAEEVVAYVGRFLDVGRLGADLVQHAARWLRGRPRWVATFLETFLVQPGKASLRTTKGRFTVEEGPFIEALDRYVNKVTTEEIGSVGASAGASSIPLRPQSWSLGPASAFAAVKRVMAKGGEVAASSETWFTVQQTLMDATFNFVLGGKRSLISAGAKDLIEHGIAAVQTQDAVVGDSSVVGVVDEPLIVQACANYFRINAAVTARLGQQDGSSAQGNAFEKFVLPAIQSNFDGVLRSLKEAPEGYSVPVHSAYGVLALACTESISETIQWIERATAARFEGLVEPFCYPDIYFGPDVLFLMWDDKHSDFLPVLAQLELRKKVASQPAALRTIFPELLYHEKRGKSAEACTNMTAQQSAAWDAAKVALLNIDAGSKKRKRKLVRLMVQYPAIATAAATTGLVAFDEVTRSKRARKQEDCDVLIVIDAKNADSLFDSVSQSLLQKLKQ